jgi:lactate dehydrogenase-like 2-hydroxyacid dehydrogenase
MVLDKNEVQLLKPGAIVVNSAFPEAVDNSALLQRVAKGELLLATDYPLSADGLPPGSLLSSNSQTGFNTVESLKRTSERATRSIIRLLHTGKDRDIVVAPQGRTETERGRISTCAPL